MDATALRRAIWDGAIPCRIELDPAESRVFDAASPYFVSEAAAAAAVVVSSA